MLRTGGSNNYFESQFLIIRLLFITIKEIWKKMFVNTLIWPLWEFSNSRQFSARQRKIQNWLDLTVSVHRVFHEIKEYFLYLFQVCVKTRWQCSFDHFTPKVKACVNWCVFNFNVCGWNPSVWPLKWKLLSCAFMWYCLLCCTRWF